MGAALIDVPVLEHQDDIGVAYRTQAVCDHKRGPPAHDLFQPLLYQVLRVRIHA